MDKGGCAKAAMRLMSSLPAVLQYCQGRPVEFYVGSVDVRVKRLLKYAGEVTSIDQIRPIFENYPIISKNTERKAKVTAYLSFEETLWRDIPTLPQKRFMAVILGFSAYKSRLFTLCFRMVFIAIIYSVFWQLFAISIPLCSGATAGFIYFLYGCFMELKRIFVDS